MMIKTVEILTQVSSQHTFELADNIEPVAILIMGYTDAEPSQEHLNRRDLQEYVSYR